MSKHQEILSYLEELPIGKRVSVRSISNHLGVSDGTAYRAIKEAENVELLKLGHVVEPYESSPRKWLLSGLPMLKSLRSPHLKF